MALRVIGLSCGLLLAAGLSFAAEAGGRGGGGAASFRPAASAVHRQTGQTFRHGLHWRHAGEAGVRHGRRHRWPWNGPGFAGPWLFDSPGGTSVAMIERQPEAIEPVDPDSFENLTARAGIRRGPVPKPTIYRLEGSRMAPVARVIRIGGAEMRGGRQTRYAHAETGALLLTVPGR